MSEDQARRGRKVAAKQRNPLLPFYLGVGALLVVGIAFLVTFAIRGGFGGGVADQVNAPVGQTADGFWYKGDPDAPVTVIKYSDFQCPSCAFYYRNLGKIIERDYIETGKVHFIYHEFPLEGFQNALPAGEASRCAGEQGAYWGMHSLLMQNQDTWAPLSNARNVFSGYAGQLGINRAAFDECLSSGRHRETLLAAAQSAIAAGITGTPTFEVNGQVVNTSGLPGAIEAALRAAGQ
ncbi:DsbA family protein [Candidatus Viridilinea mediisalina]|uniref:Disulfide bond formation protein DsbA n=1 Tax=Candidatus Viridilinea mediisalina TaxID=2024553 RepID=A0A2A6RHR1_9CHLR|nr:DsbA family protein [Candidatus Viridilinea mediisalina]PDW02473.1 disulfide bond formation protein DsbA [Candidatus Viridilinea mediisalina]